MLLRILLSLSLTILLISCSTTENQRVSNQAALEYQEVPVPEEYISDEFPKPDQWAMYPGGSTILNRTISLSIRIPEKARREGYAGRAIFSYIVDEEGNAGQVEALMSPHEAITEMYRELIAGLEQWKPAILDGEPVPQKYYIATTFRDGNAEENQ